RCSPSGVTVLDDGAVQLLAAPVRAALEQGRLVLFDSYFEVEDPNGAPIDSVGVDELFATVEGGGILWSGGSLFDAGRTVHMSESAAAGRGVVVPDSASTSVLVDVDGASGRSLQPLEAMLAEHGFTLVRT